MVQIKREISNILEYKVDNNVNILYAREKLDCEKRKIQECIAVGCVSPDAVTTTRISV